jgi:hypothetical protein
MGLVRVPALEILSDQPKEPSEQNMPQFGIERSFRLWLPAAPTGWQSDGAAIAGRLTRYF